MTDNHTEELKELHHQVKTEDSRLVNIGKQLEELGETKARQDLFDAVRTLDRWLKKYDPDAEPDTTTRKKKTRL